jgi:hypothetical protein
VKARQDAGCETPEAAARGDIPERFVTILGTRIEGDTAYVWMLTNDGPPFEAYEEVCVREHGRWFSSFGSGGLGANVPTEVLEEAARLGWTSLGSHR